MNKKLRRITVFILILSIFLTTGFSRILSSPRTLYRVYLKGESLGLIKSKKELEKYIKENYDVEVLTIKCDISKEEEVEQMVDEIIEVFGGIDILVNNASVARDSLLMDKNIKEFKRVLDVNLIGTYLVSKYVGKVMLDQKYGKIINVSSTNAIDTYYPESCDYDASKAGVISLTHNFARELAPNITVNYYYLLLKQLFFSNKSTPTIL